MRQSSAERGFTTIPNAEATNTETINTETTNTETTAAVSEPDATVAPEKSSSKKSASALR